MVAAICGNLALEMWLFTLVKLNVNIWLAATILDSTVLFYLVLNNNCIYEIKSQWNWVIRVNKRVIW
jgi:hypothetical protein